MSKRIEKETKCACCNKDSIQYEYMSRFIPKDSFYNRLMDIEECPHCHYVNMHINLESRRNHFRDIVNSPEYQSLFKDTTSINKNEANKYKAFYSLQLIDKTK